MGILNKPEDLQAKFDDYAINALNIIHDKKVTGGIVKRMKEGDPVNEIGDIAVDIANRIDAEKIKNQSELRANTIINGLNMIVGELCELSAASGLEPLNDEEKYQAYTYALSRYLADAVQQGKISKEDINKMKVMLEDESKMNQQQAKQIPGQKQQAQPEQQVPTQNQQPMQQQTPGILGGV